MKDGANQEIEEGKFVIYTGQKTATMSLGFIVGLTGTGVKMIGRLSWNNKPTRKTFSRVIQVSDELAKSMNESFFNKMRNGIKEEA